jgi:hypothetical protein
MPHLGLNGHRGTLLTTRKQYGTLIGLLIAALWFFLTAYPDRLAEGISRYIPGWFAILVLASWLVLIPILHGPQSLARHWQVVLLAIFVSITFLLSPVYSYFHPWATTLIGALCILENDWLIPRWKTKVNRDIK